MNKNKYRYQDYLEDQEPNIRIKETKEQLTRPQKIRIKRSASDLALFSRQGDG